MTESRQEGTSEDPDSLATLIAQETDDSIGDIEDTDLGVDDPWESDWEIVEE